jgi:hypothetical protein
MRQTPPHRRPFGIAVMHSWFPTLSEKNSEETRHSTVIARPIIFWWAASFDPMVHADVPDFSSALRTSLLLAFCFSLPRRVPPARPLISVSSPLLFRLSSAKSTTAARHELHLSRFSLTVLLQGATGVCSPERRDRGNQASMLRGPLPKTKTASISRGRSHFCLLISLFYRLFLTKKLPWAARPSGSPASALSGTPAN